MLYRVATEKRVEEAVRKAPREHEERRNLIS